MFMTLLRRAGFRTALGLAGLAWMVLGAQAAAQTPGPVAVGGACEDERYEALLGAGFAAMSEEQYRYFLVLDQACRMHKRDVAATVAGSPDAANPCIHEPYKTIAAKAPTSMSSREHGYFREVNPECKAYMQARGPVAGPAPTSSGPSAGQRLLTSVVMLGSIVATLVASLN